MNDYLIEYYYQFLEKLYGTKPERNEDFEKRVLSKFGKNLDKDIDIEVVLETKTFSGEIKKRKARSVKQFADNSTGELPDDVKKITFYGQFVERNENQEKLHFDKLKDKFAFKEQILIVEKVDKKHVRKVTHQSSNQMNQNIKTFTKDELEEFSKIIKFEKNELTI